MASSSYAYIDQCMEMYQSIRLGEFTPGISEISGTGSGYRFRSYGTVALSSSGEKVFVGEKIPKPREGKSNALFRVRSDLITGSLIVKYCPEATRTLPSFIARHSNPDTGQDAILTEDASFGGQVDVWADSIDNNHNQLKEALINAFPDTDDLQMLSWRNLRESVVFDADGRSRILDCSPSPFTHDGYHKLMELNANLGGLCMEAAKQMVLEI